MNSVYGKTITNKENHKNVKYFQDPESVSAMIASDRFVSLEEVGDSLCEVVNHKRVVDKCTGCCWFLYSTVGQAENARVLLRFHRLFC